MLFFKKSLAFKKNSTIISRDISFSWMNNFEQVIINDFTQLEDELFNDIIFPGSQTNLE